MQRRLFGLFTGWQLTILGCVAMLAPGALFAAVTFTPVGIVDPDTGLKSFVDSGRRLYVNDPVGNYRNNPANFVNIQYNAGGSSTSTCVLVYTPPAGKALVLTGFNGSLGNFAGTGQKQIYLDTAPNCPSPDVVGYYDNATGTTPFAVDLNSGATVAAGRSLYVYTFNATSGGGFIRGYLVPAGAVPAAATAAAAELASPVPFDKMSLARP